MQEVQKIKQAYQKFQELNRSEERSRRTEVKIKIQRERERPEEVFLFSFFSFVEERGPSFMVGLEGRIDN